MRIRPRSAAPDIAGWAAKRWIGLPPRYPWQIVALEPGTSDEEFDDLLAAGPQPSPSLRGASERAFREELRRYLAAAGVVAFVPTTLTVYGLPSGRTSHRLVLTDQDPATMDEPRVVAAPPPCDRYEQRGLGIQALVLPPGTSTSTVLSACRSGRWTRYGTRTHRNVATRRVQGAWRCFYELDEMLRPGSALARRGAWVRIELLDEPLGDWTIAGDFL